jgi:putative effector of murein hydrolase LrgA (UPF0299 family)
MSVLGLLLLLAFQMTGTALSHWLLPVLPGPILGMLLALAWLGLDVPGSGTLRQSAGELLKYLPLLLVPPAVGVMVQWQRIGADFWAISAALVLSLLVAIPLTGWLMQWLIRRQLGRGEHS